MAFRLGPGNNLKMQLALLRTAGASYKRVVLQVWLMATHQFRFTTVIRRAP